MTNAEARCNKSLRPRKPEGSLGRTAQDVHLDSHTAPELCTALNVEKFIYSLKLVRAGWTVLFALVSDRFFFTPRCGHWLEDKSNQGDYLLLIVQELCESRGGRPGLSVLTSLLVSVDGKLY